MIGNSKKWKSGILKNQIEIKGTTITLYAEKKAQAGNSFDIELIWDGGFHFSEIIEHAGQLPIPPYLRITSYNVCYTKLLRVVAFDPNEIQDHGTFANPHQYATGMVDVFVNGTQVLKNGEHTGAFPGRFVRGPGWKQ